MADRILIPKNITLQPKLSVIKIPIGTPRTSDELIPIKIRPNAFARCAGSTSLAVIVNDNTTTSAVLMAIKTLEIITRAKVELKYVNTLPNVNINNAIK